MLLNKLTETGSIKLLWPTCIEGVIAQNSVLPSADLCVRKCGASPKCDQAGVGPDERICEFGLSSFTRTIGLHRITVFGVRGPLNDTKFTRYTKDSLKGRSLDPASLQKWFSSLEGLLTEIDKAFLARQAEMLDPLHDPIRLARQVNSISNVLVQQLSSGQTFSDHVNNSSRELKSLVKASELLCDSFDLIAIYFNPESATFGKKTPVSIHGLLTKLVAVLRIQDSDSAAIHRIYLHGECHRNIFVHESFKLIPFALISNAIKYCLEYDVNVHITDRNPIVEVAVESVGPLIEPDELDMIFQKRERGKWARKVSDGRGVGLYLANVIAQAHGIKIQANSRRTGKYSGEIPLAVNRFSFEIRPT